MCKNKFSSHKSSTSALYKTYGIRRITVGEEPKGAIFYIYL